MQSYQLQTDTQELLYDDLVIFTFDSRYVVLRIYIMFVCDAFIPKSYAAQVLCSLMTSTTDY